MLSLSAKKSTRFWIAQFIPVTVCLNVEILIFRKSEFKSSLNSLINYGFKLSVSLIDWRFGKLLSRRLSIFCPLKQVAVAFDRCL